MTIDIKMYNKEEEEVEEKIFLLIELISLSY